MSILLTLLLIIAAGTSLAVFRARRTAATMLVVGLISTIGATSFVPSAEAALRDFTVPPGVTVTDGGENCKGVVPTPGSANTNKVLDPDAVQDLNPGGSASYLITFPSNPNNVGTFEIVDCVLLVGPGGAPKDFKAVLGEVSFSKVDNSADVKLAFKFAIPANAVLGDQICNVAKTTASPSKSPGSNRKAGPACFVIGGSGRLSCAFGDLAAGASRSVHVTSPTTAAACRAIPNTASAALANGPNPADAAASTSVNCPALTLGKVAGAGVAWSVDPASADAASCSIAGGKLTATNGSAPDATASTTANCPPPVAVLPLVEVPPGQAFVPAAPAPAPPLAEVKGLLVLPRTGSPVAPMARIGGIALMLGALGLLAGGRRRKTA